MKILLGIILVAIFVGIMYIIIRLANKEGERLAAEKHKSQSPFKIKVLK